MKIFGKLMTLVALTLCMAVSALAASGVTTSTANIGGATAQVAYVTMGGNRAIVPAISNNSIHTDSQVSSVISTVKSGNVVAAINGGFFNSYYNSSAALSVATGNYPRVYSTIVKEGQVICAGGDIAAIGMDLLNTHASTRKTKRLFTLSTLTTATSRQRQSLPASFRRQTQSPQHVPVQEERTYRTTSSVLKSLRKSPTPSTVLSVPSLFRQAVRFVSWSSPTSSQTTRWYCSQEILLPRLRKNSNIRVRSRSTLSAKTEQLTTLNNFSESSPLVGFLFLCTFLDFNKNTVFCGS